MKTREDLTRMGNRELRKVAAPLEVKGYGSMTKADIIDAILTAQESPSTGEEYTDRHEKPLRVNMPAQFRVNNKWHKGIITKMKTIEGDQYVYALLEGFDKVKFIHTNDCEVLKEGIAAPVVDFAPKTTPAVTVEVIGGPEALNIIKKANTPKVVVVGSDTTPIIVPVIKCKVDEVALALSKALDKDTAEKRAAKAAAKKIVTDFKVETAVLAKPVKLTSVDRNMLSYMKAFTDAVLTPINKVASLIEVAKITNTLHIVYLANQSEETLGDYCLSVMQNVDYDDLEAKTRALGVVISYFETYRKALPTSKWAPVKQPRSDKAQRRITAVNERGIKKGDKVSFTVTKHEDPEYGNTLTGEVISINTGKREFSIYFKIKAGDKNYLKKYEKVTKL